MEDQISQSKPGQEAKRTYSDPECVTRQYRDASNLNARIALHERFSTNSYGLPRWNFDQFDLPAQSRILEVGCGPGRLWTENLGSLPEGWSISLTDASPGMVSEAEARLGSDRRFEFRLADAREIPFEDGRFDAVVANHMLYHVPDRPIALAEISRVLRTRGTLYAATNGKNTHSEMGWMQRVLDPSRPTDGYFRDVLEFSLENGAEQLSPWFPEVTLRRNQDALVVTETGPLMEYLLSGSAADGAVLELNADQFGLRVSDQIERLDQELASQGAIHVIKDVGMFVARK
ncbi:MAG TPA: class I SAM-dependent methyltransferase [Rubrobacter sp.]|nr:class I SAM-dependent methyltransferase [Rubrobacter sp.]